jgi:hypothetical protein
VILAAEIGSSPQEWRQHDSKEIEESKEKFFIKKMVKQCVGGFVEKAPRPPVRNPHRRQSGQGKRLAAMMVPDRSARAPRLMEAGANRPLVAEIIRRLEDDEPLRYE